MQEIQPILERLGPRLHARAWPELRTMVGEYLISDQFNAHMGSNLVESLMPHFEVRDLTERLLDKSLQEVENMGLLLPGQPKHLEYSTLYSQQAWILHEKGDMEAARTAVNRALDHLAEPQVRNLLQLGIVTYSGDTDRGWAMICEALLRDARIEDWRADFRPALAKVIQDRLGPGADLDSFVTEYRRKHIQPLPHMRLIDLDSNAGFSLEGQGRALFICLFSPRCGSCQHEIASLGLFYRTYSKPGHLDFVFVLNLPEAGNLVAGMFKEAGIADPLVAVLETGSAYDLITEEPTTWIVNASGMIAFRFTGFLPGDEERYAAAVDSLLSMQV